MTGVKPLSFHAKKGQALIWSANLLHGGAAQKDRNRKRYSQVTHYYFRDCCYYTPLGSAPFLGPIQFRDMFDIATGQPVPNVLNGKEVRRSHVVYTSPLAHGNLDEQPVPVQKPTELPNSFDRKGYLRLNPDVAAAKVDPAQHWMEFGYKENRRWQ